MECIAVVAECALQRWEAEKDCYVEVEDEMSVWSDSQLGRFDNGEAVVPYIETCPSMSESLASGPRLDAVFAVLPASGCHVVKGKRYTQGCVDAKSDMCCTQ